MTVLDGRKAELFEDVVDASQQLGYTRIRGETQERGVEQRPIYRVIAAHQVQLGNKTDGVFHLVVFVIDVHTAQEDLRVCFFISGHGVDERGLSRSGTAQKKNHVSGLDIHKNLAQQVALVQKIPDSTILDPYGETVVADHFRCSAAPRSWENTCR